jgi:hypothetical protein
MFVKRKAIAFVLLVITTIGVVFGLVGCKDDRYYCDYCHQWYVGQPYYVLEGTVDSTLCETCHQEWERTH